MSRFQVNLAQNQIRKMTPRDVAERLREAALEQIEKRDVSGLKKYLEPLYAERELCAWAKEKFAIVVTPKELLVEGRDEERRSAAEIVELIEDRAREAYARREIEYPVDHVLTLAFGSPDRPVTDNPYAADYIRGQAKAKYNADLALDHILGVGLRNLRDELIGLQEKFLRDGELEKEIDRLIATAGKDADDDKLAAAFMTRFGASLVQEQLNRKVSLVEIEAEARTRAPESMRDKMIRRGRQVLRQELTDLETGRADSDSRRGVEGSSAGDGSASRRAWVWRGLPRRILASSTRRRDMPSSSRCCRAFATRQPT